MKTKLPLQNLYEWPNNYDWSIRACLVVQKEDGKKGYKQTN